MNRELNALFDLCLSLYMGHMGVMVYIDCTLKNFMYF
jgi:hypothetical protein